MQARLGVVYGWGMNDKQAEARARAAETKKRRTRDKLILAADHELSERGLSATVENIAEEAGVGTATFYSFYSSRNALCIDAFNQLVVDVFDDTVTDSQTVFDRAMAIGRLCVQRPNLLRAALIGRIESPTVYPKSDAGIDLHALEVRLPSEQPDKMLRVRLRGVRDFVDCIAYLLWQPVKDPLLILGTGGYGTAEVGMALHMAALELLDGVASGRSFSIEGIASTVVATIRQRAATPQEFQAWVYRNMGTGG